MPGAMSIIWAIARRELYGGFTTPMAWLVLAIWTLLLNGYFYFTIASVAESQAMGGAPSIVPLYLWTLYLGIYLLVLFAPALTMNSFATERTQGTMQLLLTVPITEWQLVLGKFIGVTAMLLSLIAATIPLPILLLVISDIHLPQVLSGYVGLGLACALLGALGLWISLLVDTNLAAYVITFGAIFVLMATAAMGSFYHDGVLAAVGDFLAVPARTFPFLQGDVRLGNVVYFLAGTGVFLVLAQTTLATRRMHG